MLKDKASEVKSTEDGYVFSVLALLKTLDLAATVISLGDGVLSIPFIFIGCKGATTDFYIWHLGLGRDEGFFKRYLRDERIKFPARLHGILVMATWRDERAGHHGAGKFSTTVRRASLEDSAWTADTVASGAAN